MSYRLQNNYITYSITLFSQDQSQSNPQTKEPVSFIKEVITH